MRGFLFFTIISAGVFFQSGTALGQNPYYPNQNRPRPTKPFSNLPDGQYPYTVVTPYGPIYHRVNSRLAIDLDNGGVFYRNQPGLVTGPGGAYVSIPGSNTTVSPHGVVIRYPNGFLTETGHFIPNSVPFQSTNGPVYPDREFASRTYGIFGNGIPPNVHAQVRARQRAAREAYIDTLPRQYQGRRALGLE